jgi:hypothetical protein
LFIRFNKINIYLLFLSSLFLIMAQSNLKSDAFCSYNQAAAPLEWVLQKGQYNNTFATGSIGINASSNSVRPDVINIDSFLSGRDDILSKCNPPIPALNDANQPPLTYQNQKNTNELQPIYTKEKKSAVNLSAVSYLPLIFEPDLPNPPQNIDHIIFGGWAQRGGADTRNIIKQSWNEDNCEAFLDPQRACGVECSEVNGYMTRIPISEHSPEARWGQLPKGFPGANWFSPSSTGTQVGKARPQHITSQMEVAVGASKSNVPQYVTPASQKQSLPIIGDPYNRFPKTRDMSGKTYPNSPIYNIVPH